MQKGDVVLMSGFTAQGQGCSASFKPPKGQFAVFLLLGDVDKKAPESFDCDQALNDMGWIAFEEEIMRTKLAEEFNDAAIADRAMRVIKGERG